MLSDFKNNITKTISTCHLSTYQLFNLLTILRLISRYYLMLQHRVIQWAIKFVPQVFFCLLGTVAFTVSLISHAMNVWVAALFIVSCLPLVFRHKLAHTILGCTFGLISGLYVFLIILVIIIGEEDGQDSRTFDMFAAGLLAVFAFLCSIAMIHTAEQKQYLRTKQSHP